MTGYVVGESREVVIVRAASADYDDYGDPVAGEDSRRTVIAEAVAPRGSTEPDARGRQAVIVGLWVALPNGTDITYTDQVEVDGELYDVEGEPGKWPGEPVEVALQRAQG